MAYSTNQVIISLDNYNVTISSNTPKTSLIGDFNISFEAHTRSNLFLLDFAIEVSFNTTRNTSFCCYAPTDANDDQNCHNTILNSKSS